MKFFFEQPKYLIAIIIIAIAIVFINNGIVLWEQDEAAYAGFAQNMIETGDWLVPDFIWSDIHRKPPMHFWAIAGSYTIFGHNEFATRIPSVLAVLLTSLLLYAIGKDLFGSRVAKIAAIVNLTTIYLPSMAKISFTDPLLLFFETLSALSLIGIFKNNRWYYYITFLVGFGFAMLTKGPPALILVGGMLFILFLFKKYRIKAVLIGLFSLLAFLPLLIWGKLAYDSDGGKYITWMIDWYVLKRVKSSTNAWHTGPPGYYLILYAISFLPWIYFIPKAISNLFRKVWKETERDDFTILILAWAFGGWLFFELLLSKSPAYAFAGYPAIAVLIANAINKFSSETSIDKRIFRTGSIMYLMAGLLLGIGAIGIGLIFFKLQGKIALFTIGAFLLAGTTLSFYYFRKKNIDFALKSALASTFVFLLLFWGFFIPSFEHERSVTKRIADYTAENNFEKVVFFDDLKMSSIAWYVADKSIPYKQVSKTWEVNELMQSEQRTAFIFLEKDFKAIETLLNLQKTKIKTFNGIISDRNKFVTYYLLYNTP